MSDGDTVVFLAPFAGAECGDDSLFALSANPLDTASSSRARSAPHAGAFVSFEGRVRDTDGGSGRRRPGVRRVPGAVPGGGERSILREAMDGIIDARCVHRVGRLAVGDVAVWIGVIAGHRDEAFRACRFIIDEVKKRVPIWKKEHYTDGSSEWIGLGPRTPREPCRVVKQPR